MVVPLFLEDPGKLLPGNIEVFVNYSVFELPGVRQLFACVLHPAQDHGFGVLPARTHAPLELFHRRRQDEDADALRIERAHLARALPIDLENDVGAALHRIENHFLRRAVTVAVDFGAFEEFAPRLHGEEAGVVHEVIFAAIDLPRARWPRGVRNGQLQAGVVAQYGVDERALARPRRGGNDEEQAVRFLRSVHSMFCACSRICSVKSFSSSAHFEIAGLAAFAPSVLASRFSSCVRKSSRLPTGVRVPPWLSKRSISLKCARSRVSSSSTSTFAANTAISARMRSSCPEPNASRSRSASFVSYAAMAWGSSGATSSTCLRMDAMRSRIAVPSFSPSRARAETSSSSARSHSAWAAARIFSSSASAWVTTPGQRSTSASRNGPAPGNRRPASSASALRRASASGLNCCGVWASEESAK